MEMAFQINLLYVVGLVAYFVQRTKYLGPRPVEEEQRVLLVDLPRDVIFVGALQLRYRYVILHHLPVHIVDDVAQDFVLVLVVFDFADFALQQIVPQLVVVVVEHGPV